MSESPPNAWIHVLSEELQSFAAPLFVTAGLDAEKAASVARLLILTDIMGLADPRARAMRSLPG
jgi:LDH2 family malate/lactate/ureidoglycolate dehydrogenase